jgi:hypothetical protein
MEMNAYWEGVVQMFGFLVLLFICGGVILNFFQRIKLNDSSEREISAVLCEPFRLYVQRLLEACERAEKRAHGLPVEGYEAAIKSINMRWISSIDKLYATHRDAAQFALSQNLLALTAPYGKQIDKMSQAPHPFTR